MQRNINRVSDLYRFSERSEKTDRPPQSMGRSESLVKMCNLHKTSHGLQVISLCKTTNRTFFQIFLDFCLTFARTAEKTQNPLRCGSLQAAQKVRKYLFRQTFPHFIPFYYICGTIYFAAAISAFKASVSLGTILFKSPTTP